MASYARATGEAQTLDFVTLSCAEFYTNTRESYRLCVTSVKGIPKINLSKFWFNLEEKTWLPTRSHFYFNKEGWESLVKQIAKLNTELPKTGLFGMRIRFYRKTKLHLFLAILLMSPDTFQPIIIPYLISQFR